MFSWETKYCLAALLMKHQLQLAEEKNPNCAKITGARGEGFPAAVVGRAER